MKRAESSLHLLDPGNGSSGYFVTSSTAPQIHRLVTPAVLPPVSWLIHSSPPVVAFNCSADSPFG
ncbi:hypothetical protein SBA3_4270008 [Candidatus Sulfopaludibacter sp. SbA3]|nr:hypothetical protein SBA3_4270008 [Candidatus Sulfopaludibacter sp. SbA3]